MKEIKTIINAYSTIDIQNTPAALATIVHIEGSSYRRMGARMLVMGNGNYLGGISGGCLEGDALRKAQKAIVQNRSSIVRYDTTQEDDHQVGVGLGCNGIIDVLFTPLHEEDANNPIKILSAIVETREPRLMVTITGCNNENTLLAHSTVYENDEQFCASFPIKTIALQIIEDLKQYLENKRSGSKTYQVETGEATLFFEIIMPQLQLIIYGGNYDVYPLIRIAKELGWRAVVVTNMSKAKKSLFQLADKIIDQEEESGIQIDHYTAILLMSHDYNSDFNNLQSALNSNASYIGILGPRKRSIKMFESLENTGNAISEKAKERIYSPAGLDIGAATPEEIALSISAEIQSHFTGSAGKPLRTKKGTIHNHQ